MDYEKLGFRAGLEIHQQIDTKKLFCKCPSKLADKGDYNFFRRLRPTQSELGEIDRAAIAEMKKGRTFFYEASNCSTCLVEADEEPPHEMNREALDVALTVALMLNADIVDEIHVMRKIVIDGSATSGFQRTALIALSGKAKDVGIETIAIEEDAARKLEEDGKKVTYGLDRLGIPLIEVSTSADIKSPKHAREIAEYIGSLFQSTGKCKRGLGTIRQDINVSIKGGARVEIKGVQSLSAIEKVAEFEALRQVDLLEIKKILKERGIEEKDIKEQVAIDVSDFLKKSDSRMIKKALSRGERALALKLPGFSGLLKRKYSRLGKEFAVHARVRGGIGGIIHSDELPGYGIDEKIVEKLKVRLEANEKDAFALFIGKKLENAINAVKERAVEALKGVPEEVRKALPDHTTEYMRPLPGSARMYPETDVPPIRIKKEYIERLMEKLPEMPERREERMIKEYGLNRELVRQLLNAGYANDFERLAKKFPGHERTIAKIFLNVFPEIEKEGVDVSLINTSLLEEVLVHLEKGSFAKEGLPELLKYIALHRDKSVDEAIDACNLRLVKLDELREFVRRAIRERKDFVKEKGMRAFAPLMGIVMDKYRGRMDGKVISEIVKEELNSFLESSS